MTTLDSLINRYISGSPNYWYYDFELARVHFGGCYFYRRADCRRHMKARLRNCITNDKILKHYLELVANKEGESHDQG
jgi:hypothetical protein